MTILELKQIESEAIGLIYGVLDAVRNKSLPDYVLLISRAGYQVELEGTDLSPYVLASQLESIKSKRQKMTYCQEKI